MASRENQGLHIALILLVMLTVGLCVLSFVFYSKAENRRAEAEDAKNRAATAEGAERQSNFKTQMLNLMINGQHKSYAEIKEELDNNPGATDADPNLAQTLRNFENNMLLFGPADKKVEKARNYEALPDFLLSRIRDLNQQLADLRRTENQLNQEKTNLEAAAKTRVDAAEAERDKARNDLAAERDKFTKDLGDVRKQMDGIASQLTEKDNRIVELNTLLDDERTASAKQLDEQKKTITDLRMWKKSREKSSFEVPDAIVTTVNQREGMLYIDIGSADNLKVKQTFSVYDKGTTGVMEAQPKGRIEVLQVLGDHVAMCHIKEDKVSNVIVPGDLIFTPAWSPGQRLHFAIAGFIDVTDSGQNDADLVSRLIELNGGVVDDEVTVQTRYLIEGEHRDEVPGGDPVDNDRDAKIAAAIEIGVDRMDADKLLTLMGWRADISTVTLGSGKAYELPKSKSEEPEESPFRKRTPPRGTDGAF